MEKTEALHPYSRGARADYTWSARFLFEQPHTVDVAVARKLGGIVADYANPEWPISGAILGAGEAQDRTTLVLGLNPSNRFGTPDIGRCEAIAAKITETLGWQRQPETPAEMRIILGRRVGYEGRAYSMDETRNLMVAHNCGSLVLTEADLFSLRYVGGVCEYDEPGVIVEGPADVLGAALQAAAAMGQEWLVAEVTGIETQVYFQERD